MDTVLPAFEVWTKEGPIHEDENEYGNVLEGVNLYNCHDYHGRPNPLGPLHYLITSSPHHLITSATDGL